MERSNVTEPRIAGSVVQRGQLVVLESTTYPGTTREQLVPLLEQSGLEVGDGLNVAFSPERVDPGRTDYTLRNTPKVVGGITQSAPSVPSRSTGACATTSFRFRRPRSRR